MFLCIFVLLFLTVSHLMLQRDVNEYRASSIFIAELFTSVAEKAKIAFQWEKVAMWPGNILVVRNVAAYNIHGPVYSTSPNIT